MRQFEIGRCFMLVLLLLGVLMVVVSPVLGNGLSLVWEGEVCSTGAEVVTSSLVDGVLYLIVVEGNWLYDSYWFLAADAMYYTTDSSDSWQWQNHFPAPGGHSFLQINSNDVDWGPFSNGDTGHRYSIYYEGEGAPITFRIVDWVDDDYENNICRLGIRIYKEVTVGGYVVDNDSRGASAFSVDVLLLAGFVTLPFIEYFRKCRRRKV